MLPSTGVRPRFPPCARCTFQSPSSACVLLTSTSFPSRGFKAQVFLTELTHGPEHPTDAQDQLGSRTSSLKDGDGPTQAPSVVGSKKLLQLSILSSTRQHLTLILHNLAHIEAFFPGLQRVQTVEQDMHAEEEPVQVAVLGGQASVSSVETARAVQRLLLERSADELMAHDNVKARDSVLRLDLPMSNLRFTLEVSRCPSMLLVGWRGWVCQRSILCM